MTVAGRDPERAASCSIVRPKRAAVCSRSVVRCCHRRDTRLVYGVQRDRDRRYESHAAQKLRDRTSRLVLKLYATSIGQRAGPARGLPPRQPPKDGDSSCDCSHGRPGIWKRYSSRERDEHEVGREEHRRRRPGLRDETIGGNQRASAAVGANSTHARNRRARHPAHAEQWQARRGTRHEPAADAQHSAEGGGCHRPAEYRPWAGVRPSPKG